MALFPECTFKVLLPKGTVTPGRRLEGILELYAPEPIPRAERIELLFRSSAWAGYGSGKSRSVLERVLFTAPMTLELSDSPLAAGTHRHPFAFDVPAWLPPALVGHDCGIVHKIDVRLDVDWAKDPVAHLAPVVELEPREGVRSTLTVRSPRGFHESLVLDVTLASSVIAHGENLDGQIALRGGHDARFDAVVVSLVSSAMIVMGRGDRRRGAAMVARIPADSLRTGEPVAFRFRSTERIPSTFLSSFIDHHVVLVVSVDIPWSIDPEFELPVLVLPRGSTIHGDTDAVPVGQARLRGVAAFVSRSTGLREGRLPVLVEGTAGPVAFRVTDAPRDGAMGVDCDFTFPDVELGLTLRPLGLLDRLRESPLLPEVLRDRYLLRFESQGARTPTADSALAAFSEALLGDLGHPDEVRASDHHLGLHYRLDDDAAGKLVATARFAEARAKLIAAAIAALPFPAEATPGEPAWRATAREEGATLVPSGPSIHALALRARVLGGEMRELRATLRTVWTRDEPITQLEVALDSITLPREACAELEGDTTPERLRTLRALFPTTHASADGRSATLQRPGFTPDPRGVLSGFEAFLAWVLEVRSERRADAPYR